MSAKQDAAKKAAAAARKARDAAAAASAAKSEKDRKRALEEAEQNARIAADHAEEVARRNEFEIAEGERLAREHDAIGFWQKFKTAVGW